MQPDDVLDFWFGAPGTAELGTTRSLWFTRSDATDAGIRMRFGGLVEDALAGRLDDRQAIATAWTATPAATLALVLLLDQFTRNIFRETARAFAGDAQALALARRLQLDGDARALTLRQRWFAAMPFEHSEVLADQELSVQLFESLAADGLPDPLPWALRHRDVIRRFGRFPHRNALLGRASTASELDYLAQPGAGF